MKTRERSRWPSLLLLLPLVMSAAVCAAVDAMERADEANYRSRCATVGFRPGTDAFAECMMQQFAQDEARNQRSIDRL